MAPIQMLTFAVFVRDVFDATPYCVRGESGKLMGWTDDEPSIEVLANGDTTNLCHAVQLAVTLFPDEAADAAKALVEERPMIQAELGRYFTWKTHDGIEWERRLKSAAAAIEYLSDVAGLEAPTFSGDTFADLVAWIVYNLGRPQLESAWRQTRREGLSGAGMYYQRDRRLRELRCGAPA